MKKSDISTLPTLPEYTHFQSELLSKRDRPSPSVILPLFLSSRSCSALISSGRSSPAEEHCVPKLQLNEDTLDIFRKLGEQAKREEYERNGCSYWPSHDTDECANSESYLKDPIATVSISPTYPKSPKNCTSKNYSYNHQIGTPSTNVSPKNADRRHSHNFDLKPIRQSNEKTPLSSISSKPQTKSKRSDRSSSAPSSHRRSCSLNAMLSLPHLGKILNTRQKQRQKEMDVLNKKLEITSQKVKSIW